MQKPLFTPFVATFSSLQAQGVLSLSVPDEPPISLQSGGISVLGRVGRLTSTSHYSSESGDFHAVYPAGSVECPGSSNDLLAMSAVSYRTSIGKEPAAPASLLRVGNYCARTSACDVRMFSLRMVIRPSNKFAPILDQFIVWLSRIECRERYWCPFILTYFNVFLYRPSILPGQRKGSVKWCRAKVFSTCQEAR